MSGVRVAVAEGGRPWVVARNGRILRKRYNEFEEVSGRAKDISISGGAVYAIGYDRHR